MNDEYYYGPMWIDPRFWDRMHMKRMPRRWGEGETYEKTVTTTGANTVPTQPAAMTEEQVRKIVREEMSDLVKPDVPDAPPEDWGA